MIAAHQRHDADHHCWDIEQGCQKDKLHTTRAHMHCQMLLGSGKGILNILAISHRRLLCLPYRLLTPPRTEMLTARAADEARTDPPLPGVPSGRASETFRQRRRCRTKQPECSAAALVIRCLSHLSYRVVQAKEAAFFCDVDSRF